VEPTWRPGALTSYLIAKYVPDLARNEPVNIGLVVYDGTRVAARFEGETDDRPIDLRRVRHRIPSSRAYQQWVMYWRRALNDPAILDETLREAAGGDARVIDRLVNLPARDFYLEHGGTIAFDLDEPTLDETLGELYERLVRGREAPAEMSLHEKSVESFRAAGIRVNDERVFITRPPVTLRVHGVEIPDEFSFAVRNGRLHYVQEVGFDPTSALRTRKELGRALLLLDNLPDGERAIALFDSEDVVAATRPLVEVLRAAAPLVDVLDPAPAAKQITELIGTQASTG
jgi:hypothetical protein